MNALEALEIVRGWPSKAMPTAIEHMQCEAAWAVLRAAAEAAEARAAMDRAAKQTVLSPLRPIRDEADRVAYEAYLNARKADRAAWSRYIAAVEGDDAR